MTRHLFIINPTAGNKDRSVIISKNIENMKLSEPYDIIITDGVGAATRDAEKYLDDHPTDFVRVYACGGDGTLCETAEGIIRSGRSDCALAAVPVGSGNDFVKSFDIPESNFRDLRALVVGETKEIDAMRVTDDDGRERVSLNIVSAGFDAAVAKGLDKFKKLPLVSGSAAYNMSLVQCLVTKMKHRFRLFADGEEIKDGDIPYLFAIAANGKYYGGGFKASPYSDLCDGLMDFVRITTISRVKFLALVGKFRQGRHITEMKKYVTYTRCKRLKIVASGMLDVNLDGEIFPMRNPEMRIVPKCIKIILPAK